MRRLLIRPGAIGDCILALPELESARADYTEVWAPGAVLPLIQFADRTRAIADTGLDLIGVRDDASLEELESFDSIYSWYGFNFEPFRDAVRHLPFTFFPALPINVTGTPRIRVPDLPRENLAILHPLSGSAKKNWPLEHFQELASRLDQSVKFCAGPDATHIENLYDLACWISTASVYIGNDSGITHLAAAVGTPVVAIFLATDPQIWQPRGENVVVLQRPTVGQVLAAANSIRR
jgi:heptosyltransferase-3